MTSSVAPTTPPVTFVFYADPDIEVVWGDYGIEAATWGDAELSEAPGMAALAQGRTSVADPSPEDEAWLGHA